MLKIIGVHGLLNKPDQSTLADWWEKSLREGLRKNERIEENLYDFELVYWSDLIYEEPLKSESQGSYKEGYVEEPYAEATSENLIEYSPDLMDRLRKFVSQYLGPAADYWKKYQIDDVMDLYISSREFFKDLRIYFKEEHSTTDRNGDKRQTRDVLKDELKNTLRSLKANKCILIAHSMGTIISYESLLDLGESDPELSIDAFLTIGSPLGIPEIRQRMLNNNPQANEPLRVPEILSGEWLNFADTRDTNALDPYLADDFSPNDQGVKFEDILVRNTYESPSGSINPHKSYGYLRTPEFSRNLHRLMGKCD